MYIEESFFKLKPIDECSQKFDLELLYTINKGKSNERNEFKNVAYSISLENAIRKIAHYAVERKRGDVAIKLKEYFSDYITELRNVEKRIFGDFNIRSKQPG